MENYKDEFIKILNSINRSKHNYEIFSDWLKMSAAVVYHWKHDKQVEQEYAEIAQKYSTEELKKHAHLTAFTVMALDKHKHDFLGDIFTIINKKKRKKDQYFTPLPLAQFLAQGVFGHEGIQKDKYYTIYDPCCGSGILLIETLLYMVEHNFDYRRKALFLGADIDERCARMTFIQLSILGAPALIKCGDALNNEIMWKRETKEYYRQYIYNRF